MLRKGTLMWMRSDCNKEQEETRIASWSNLQLHVTGQQNHGDLQFAVTLRVRMDPDKDSHCEQPAQHAHKADRHIKRGA